MTSRTSSLLIQERPVRSQFPPSSVRYHGDSTLITEAPGEADNDVQVAVATSRVRDPGHSLAYREYTLLLGDGREQWAA